jgi:hypothetical protein
MGLKFSSDYYKFHSVDGIVLKESTTPLGILVRAANSFLESLVFLKYAMNGKLLSRKAINSISDRPKTIILALGILIKKNN